MAQLYYQGHGSYRITSKNGMVVYIDPYVGDGYDLPADLILVSHEHGDHNVIELVSQKPGCRIIRAADLLKDGSYAELTVNDIKIEAVEAYNRNHKKDESVGFILTVDGSTIYASGDTSETAQMKTFAARKLTLALLPIDGVYNMGPEEASRCAAIIRAKNTIPVHMKPGSLFDRDCAEAFKADGRVILAPGETFDL